MKHPLHLCFCFCGLLFISSLQAQFATTDPYAKQIDTYVQKIDDIRFSDSVIVSASSGALAALSPPGDITGYYASGQLVRIISDHIEKDAKAFEVAYYFRNDSLLYINMEYSEAVDFYGSPLFVVQYRKAHYFKNGTSVYWNYEGSGAKVPASYVRDPVVLAGYVNTYKAELLSRKK